MRSKQKEGDMSSNRGLTPFDPTDPAQLEEAEKMMMKIVTPRINAVLALDYWIFEFKDILRDLEKEREAFGFGTKEAKRITKAMTYIKKARERVIAAYKINARTR